jgi:ADP-L-glycero-D-manno-heptose 6-epimerase
METDGRYMMENNYRYSLELLDWCQARRVPFIYASSASVYGAGRIFREAREFEAPLNVYGYSKFLFDQVVRSRLAERSAQIAGFRYFNVYGRASRTRAAWLRSPSISSTSTWPTAACASSRAADGYGPGEQIRDFVSVEDAVRVNLHFLDHPVSGVFNVGTGRAQSFNEVAAATINAIRRGRGEKTLSLDEIKRSGAIEYIAFPAALVGKYQSHTEADISALRAAGYDAPFLDVEEGVGRYVAERQRALKRPV